VTISCIATLDKWLSEAEMFREGSSSVCRQPAPEYEIYKPHRHRNWL
jgi:hypothetical protein